MQRWLHPGREQLSQLSGHVAHSDSGAARGGGEERENGVRVSKGDHKGLEKEDRCEKDTRKREDRKSGEPVNWTSACISCPLDWVSGAIKTADMRTGGGGLGEVMLEQEAGALSSPCM